MGRALVLNATYEPLSVVSARRAVVLVLRDKADPVEVSGDTWRTASSRIDVPSVLRLRHFVKVPYLRRVPLTRKAVFARDDHRCQYCGSAAESLDHVTPRSKGGAHTWDNVVACCRRCNTRKGSRTPAQSGLSLARHPTLPSRHGWVYAKVGRTVDPLWHAYLAPPVERSA